MKCDICKKNHAHLHLTRIVGGKPYALHVCANCAKEKGVNNPAAAVPLEALLAGADEAAQAVPREELKRQDIDCPRCGRSYRNFRDSGKLGCGDCYSSFEELLVPLMERIQRDTRHIGKVPSRLAKSLKIETDISSLRHDLAVAVAEEDFERAAGLRDRIRDLELQKAEAERE